MISDFSCGYDFSDFRQGVRDLTECRTPRIYETKYLEDAISRNVTELANAEYTYRKMLKRGKGIFSLLSDIRMSLPCINIIIIIKYGST